jgi:hypothetical protein
MQIKKYNQYGKWHEFKSIAISTCFVHSLHTENTTYIGASLIPFAIRLLQCCAFRGNC